MLIVCLVSGRAAWATSGSLEQRPGTARTPAVIPSAHPAAQQNPQLHGELIDRFAGQPTALEQRLFADAADGSWDEHSLLSAALIASGVDDPDSLAGYEKRLAMLLEPLRQSDKLKGSPRRRAEAILEFLHRRLLSGGYRLECSDLRLALDRGWYNCVSASVLFQCLAEQLGLSVCALEVPGHAMSRVRLDDGVLDIETTCPQWFRLLGDPTRQAEWAQQTLGHLSVADRQRAREVSRVELVAMIYYNRGVDLLAEKQFAAAVAANAKALRLDPASATARGNLLATVNNWAIALGSTGQYSAAAELLREGLAVDPSFQPFTLNYLHVHQQWSRRLCEAGQFQEALAVLSQAAAEHPEQGFFRQAAAEVQRRAAPVQSPPPAAAGRK